ncbi:unnamed protein product, partial [Amoebophrya sp. A25]|eukprot:GSA25T00018863001.1
MLTQIRDCSSLVCAIYPAFLCMLGPTRRSKSIRASLILMPCYYGLCSD